MSMSESTSQTPFPMSSVASAAGIATFDSLPLDGGGALSPVRLAWSRYGPEPAQARSVVLLLHGISGSHHALPPASGPAYPDAGWASAWLGPDALLDTRQTCVLVPNALGSCFGSSGPADSPAASATSATSAADFPPVSIADTVRLQGLWLRSLGVARLDAVLGFSYGGYQAFQWAVAGPVPAARVVVLASAPRGNGTAQDVTQLRQLAAALDAGVPAAREAWVAMRRATLQRYGYAAWLADRQPHDMNAVEARLQDEAEAWAARFSPWSLAALRDAARRFDASVALAAAPMPVHWLRCTSDVLFPPDDDAAAAAARADYPASVVRTTVHGRYGHLSPLLEAEAWQAPLRLALR
ncbi:alpha/beta fold hydrolase [Cupriavidus sp. WS]|uniref:alpha/beta fold hydrolase n=1 Tax=Cupriavidus sp. WS TaxID=1312922 RepID=UPI00036FE87B|nr:alpha/beta fold hydrolase [Cupriavidus sp. WS]